MINENVIESNIKVENGSFIYKLHKEDIFDTDLFLKLVKSLTENKSLYENNERMSIVNIFTYVLKSFIYHLYEGDQSTIVNFEEVKDKITCYIDISDFCISCLSSNTQITHEYIAKTINEHL